MQKALKKKDDNRKVMHFTYICRKLSEDEIDDEELDDFDKELAKPKYVWEGEENKDGLIVIKKEVLLENDVDQNQSNPLSQENAVDS